MIITINLLPTTPYTLHSYTKSRSKPDPPIPTTTPILSSSYLAIFQTQHISTALIHYEIQPCITTSPLLFINTSKCTSSTPSDNISHIYSAIASHFSVWLTIDDMIGTRLGWSQTHPLFNTICHLHSAFTSKDSASIFTSYFLLHPIPLRHWIACYPIYSCTPYQFCKLLISLPHFLLPHGPKSSAASFITSPHHHMSSNLACYG